MRAQTTHIGKRELVRDAAIQVFIEDGYGASMARIAARAGVAKQTLYNQFGNKENLFAEVIRQSVDDITVSLGDSKANLRLSLLRFAAAFRAKALSPHGLGMHRALIAEAPRFRVRAAGARKQAEGCPDVSREGLSADRLERLCRGEINAGLRLVVARDFRAENRVPVNVVAAREIDHQGDIAVRARCE